MQHPTTCGRVFESLRGELLECVAVGDHFCEPRALHVVAFFDEILVHTKGRWARKRFTLSPWQEHEIIRPLFGLVRWSEEHEQYVRRYTVAWIELGRKNGKSELAAGIALYLLEGDGEEGAEVYGAAKDTGQAKKVWDVALRMSTLSPHLRGRITVNRRDNKLIDEANGSWYETVTRDALGELGHNPHGVVFDEVISQPDGDLWEALRTAMGARTEPLMLALTTAGRDQSSFAAVMHQEMGRVADDPARAPHVFVYRRNLPADADVWDEANWYFANPALGDFLSIESLREEALEARANPRAENAFRQFRANQWVQQQTRWLPLHEWDACVGEIAATPAWMLPKLAGRVCHGGLDLSARLDLTALAWIFPGDDYDDVLWRFWIPQDALHILDKASGGQATVWARDGWITVTDGDVIDYERVYADFETDADQFAIDGVAYDEWGGEAPRQELGNRTGVELYPIRTTYDRMTGPLQELELRIKARRLRHFGNPVARWCVDNLTVISPRDDPNKMRPVRPDRKATGARIDGAVALVNAIAAQLTAEAGAATVEPSAIYV